MQCFLLEDFYKPKVFLEVLNQYWDEQQFWNEYKYEQYLFSYLIVDSINSQNTNKYEYKWYYLMIIINNPKNNSNTNSTLQD